MEQIKTNDDDAKVSLDKFIKPYIGALDQGTSSTRFIIYDARCAIIEAHQIELPHVRPQPGWVEIEPYKIIEHTNECMAKCVQQLEARGGAAKDIVAVGITNQRETSLIWDASSASPIHNALVWLDTRTDKLVEDMVQNNKAFSEEKGGKNALKKQCGLPLATYFSAPKLKWILQHTNKTDAASRQNLIAGTVDTWVVWNLTGGKDGGVHVTDVTNASRTMLMNLHTKQWDDELCGVFELSKDMLPAIKSSAEVYGKIAQGPLKGVPIAAILGDQQAALVGHLAFKVGQAKNTYGTGCFLLYNTGKEIVHSQNALTTIGYQLGANAPCVYALEGSIAIAGAALKWLKEEMCMLRSYEEIDELVSKVENTNGMYFVPAFSGLFAPHWRDDARGVAVGLNESVTRAHFVRAVLEGIAFQTWEIVNALNEDAHMQMECLKASGGLAKSDVFLQLQADILGIPIGRPDDIETTAKGAAIAAGIALGVFKETDLVKDLQDGEKEWQPKNNVDARQERQRQWLKAVDRSLGWIDKDKKSNL